jgi:hypothetical protein
MTILIRCVQLFPLTDFRHVILTPTVLLVADVLSQPSVPSSERGTRRTLFLCALALHLSSAAGRWLPELHATASRLLGASLDARAALLADAPTTALLRPLRFATLGAEGGGGDSGGAAAAALRLDAAGATFNLTHDLIRTSTNLPCFAEIWGPTLAPQRHQAQAACQTVTTVTRGVLGRAARGHPGSVARALAVAAAACPCRAYQAVQSGLR